MRYAVSMTPGLRLNTASAHTWAAVVSGTAWKRHTLSPAGVLTAEYTRGPLILWATRPGEEEGLHADGPAVSALEDRVDRLNTAQVFERFYWAARGKVRPSVRWKTSPFLHRRKVIFSRVRLLHAGLFFEELGRRVRRIYFKAAWKQSVWESIDQNLFLFNDSSYKRSQKLYYLRRFSKRRLENQAYKFKHKRVITRLSEIFKAFAWSDFSEEIIERRLIYKLFETKRPIPWEIQPRPPSAPLAPPVI